MGAVLQMEKFKVIVSETMSDEGLAVLEEFLEVSDGTNMSRQELLDVIDQYDALIVRSATQVDEELLSKASNLKVVGRAGNGIDNIVLDAATKYGVVVANTPESNTVSAAEHAVALLLASARNIPAADRQLKSGEWDRSYFKGTELFGKTIGVIGLGKIGSLVASRLKAFQTRVIAYDPYISDDRFGQFGAEKAETLEEILTQSDIITIHTPRTPETTNMIDEAQFELMKKGVRLVNDARGGIINEAALIKYLENGKVRSAALDVHAKEPSDNHELMRRTDVVVTPHIGADTDEAQENVGVTIANQVIAALNGEVVANAVNLPTLNRENLATLKPYVLALEKFGKVYYQLFNDAIESVSLKYYGSLAKEDTEMLTLAALKGILEPVLLDRVNYVNAKLIAEQRGMTVTEKKYEDNYAAYSDFAKISIKTKTGKFSIAGNVDAKGEARILEIDGYSMDLAPSKYMLFIKNLDVPGVIGKLGTLLGEEEINIATMQVGRDLETKKALMVVGIDNACSKESLEKISKLENITMAKLVIM